MGLFKTNKCLHLKTELFGPERQVGFGWTEQDYKCVDCGHISTLRFHRYRSR